MLTTIRWRTRLLIVTLSAILVLFALGPRAGWRRPEPLKGQIISTMGDAGEPAQQMSMSLAGGKPRMTLVPTFTSTPSPAPTATHTALPSPEPPTTATGAPIPTPASGATAAPTETSAQPPTTTPEPTRPPATPSPTPAPLANAAAAVDAAAIDAAIGGAAMLDEDAVDAAAVDMAAVDVAKTDATTVDATTVDEATVDEATVEGATVDVAAVDEAAVDVVTTDMVTVDDATGDATAGDEPSVDAPAIGATADDEATIEAAAEDEAAGDGSAGDMATVDTAAAPPGQPNTDDPVIAALAARINEARAKTNATALSWSPALAQAAMIQATDMAAQKTVTHTGSDGSTVTVRMQRVGYDPAYRGEIIACAPGGPETAFAWWWESTLHHDTLLGPAYRDFGIAHAPHPAWVGQEYYVVVFGSER